MQKPGKKYKSQDQRAFERKLRELGTTDECLVFEDGQYTNECTEAMWLGYQLAAKVALEHSTGSFIIGKADKGRVVFTRQPYLHRNYALGLEELARLAETNKGETFVLYQSVTSRGHIKERRVVSDLDTRQTILTMDPGVDNSDHSAIVQPVVENITL